MFFATNVKAFDIAETLPRVDHVKICAHSLRAVCKNFDFNEDGSFHSPEDLEMSSQY